MDVSESMITAFDPDRIKAFEASDTGEQWFACVEALGFPYATPEQVGEIAAKLIERPDAIRADLARAYPFEVFAILGWASHGLPEETRNEIYSHFPGLLEALECARARYGERALLIACGVDPLKPSEAMIEALKPDSIKTAIHPDRLKAAAKVLGLDDLKPEQTGSVVHTITETYSEDDRAELVRNHTAEIWTLIAAATLPYPEAVSTVVDKFPGLFETFNAASDRYGLAEMLKAEGTTIH